MQIKLILIQALIIFNNINNITVDVSEINQLKLSELSRNIKMIPLETNAQTGIFNVSKIAVSDKYVYVLAGDELSKGFPIRLLMYDWNGHFIKQIGLKDNTTNKYIPVTDLVSDENAEILYLKVKNGWQLFRSDGNYIKDIKIADETYFSCYFSNKLWTIICSADKGKEIYKFVSVSMDGSISGPVFTLEDKLAEYLVSTGVTIYSHPAFSVHNNTLNVSFIVDHSLYVYNGQTLKKEYEFTLKNCEPAATDKYLGTGIYFLGDYLIFGYIVKGATYQYITNTNTNRSYNIKYSYNNNQRVLLGGINDDIYLTGYFKIMPTNRNNNFYFTKKPDEVNTISNEQKNSYNDVLFMVEL